MPGKSEPGSDQARRALRSRQYTSKPLAMAGTAGTGLALGQATAAGHCFIAGAPLDRRGRTRIRRRSEAGQHIMFDARPRHSCGDRRQECHDQRQQNGNDGAAQIHRRRFPHFVEF